MPFKHRCLLLAALLTLVHLARFDVMQGPIVTDVRYYVYFAGRMVDGAVPHRDFFDNKTQLATAAGAVFYGLGESLDVSPLLAMRVGYLGLTGLAALLLFAIHRRLSDGSCVAGLLGMACYLGFSLLGFLPAIGPLPKLLMGVLASASALLALRGAWLAAGALAALAFFDWQIGALAGVAVFVAALCERERWAAVARVTAGGVAVIVAALAYFAWNGALGVAWRQIVLTSLARGESALAAKTFSGRVAQILESIAIACPGHAWLAVVGVAGMAIFPVLLLRHRGRPTLRLVIALAVYHYGIVAFSLTDYQAYGDLFALLASLALFAGVALNELLRVVEALSARLFGGAATPEVEQARKRVAIAMLVVALLALRIGWPRLDINLPDKIARGATTLDEQESVARQITAATAGLRTVYVNCPEQLYLTRHTNPLPFGFWNRATHNYFRESAEEQSPEALGRLLRSIDAQAVLCATPRVQNDLEKSGAFDRIDLHASSGGYGVVLLRRKGTTPTPASSKSITRDPSPAPPTR